MSELYFDIRGNDLKVLITDGQAVKYARIFGEFSLENREEARNILQQISGESGLRPDSVHLIPPSGEFRIRTFRLQKMSPDDARLIIRRKIMTEEGIDDPVFHLMARASMGRHQEFVATLIDPEGLKRYLTFFSGSGIPVRTLSPSFHANLKTFEQSKSDIPQTCAIFEVGRDTIEIMVVSPSQIITYEIVPVASAEEGESSEKPETERIRKKRLYGIIDALYKFMLSYREKFSDVPIEKVLLCGKIDPGERTAEAVEEGIGIQASLWNPFGETVPEGAALSALYGLAAGVSDGTAANLISAELLKRKRTGLSRSAMAAMLCIYFATAAAVVFLAETRYRSTKEILGAELREKQALDFVSAGAGSTASLQKLPARQTPLYEVFRYLGNNLPDGVSLDEIVFKQEGGDGSLYMKFVSKHDLNIGKKRLFTRVIDSLNASGRLSVIKEPSFSVSGDTKQSLIHFQVACRVIP